MHGKQFKQQYRKFICGPYGYTRSIVYSQWLLIDESTCRALEHPMHKHINTNLLAEWYQTSHAIPLPKVPPMLIFAFLLIMQILRETTPAIITAMTAQVLRVVIAISPTLLFLHKNSSTHLWQGMTTLERTSLLFLFYKSFLTMLAMIMREALAPVHQMKSSSDSHQL